jgi:hypothetical protein
MPPATASVPWLTIGAGAGAADTGPRRGLTAKTTSTVAARSTTTAIRQARRPRV